MKFLTPSARVAPALTLGGESGSPGGRGPCRVQAGPSYLLVPRSGAKATASHRSWRFWARFCYGESAPYHPDIPLIMLSYAAFWSTGWGAFPVPPCRHQETLSSGGKMPPWLVIMANWPLGQDSARCCAHPASPSPFPGPVWPLQLRLRG